MKLNKCDLSPYESNRVSKLKSHQLSIHSDLRPWKCTHPACRYTCKVKDSLRKHLILHESDSLQRNSFACTFKDCDYRASRKCNLNSHVKHRHTSTAWHDMTDYAAWTYNRRSRTTGTVGQHSSSTWNESSPGRYVCEAVLHIQSHCVQKFPSGHLRTLQAYGSSCPCFPANFNFRVLFLIIAVVPISSASKFYQ